MNDPENKRMLWDLTNHLYKAWMSREQVIATFEQTIKEVNEGTDDPLIDKNKRFLSIYVERVNSIYPADAMQRAAMFEERLNGRLKAPVEKKTVSFLKEDEVIEIVDDDDWKKSIQTLQRQVKVLQQEVLELKKVSGMKA
jgi:hypothetical protein